MNAGNAVRVWDRFVRVFHWSLVTAFALAWLSTESIGWLHKGAGYAALGLVAARVVWGFIGSHHARFVHFVPGPRKLGRYLAALARCQEPRYLGHNPAGAVMIVCLLLAMAGIGVTGWMLTLDAFWGNETLEAVHSLLAEAALGAAVVHVLANIVGGWRHGENLIAAMLTGNKPSHTARHPAQRVDAAPSKGNIGADLN